MHLSKDTVVGDRTLCLTFQSLFLLALHYAESVRRILLLASPTPELPHLVQELCILGIQGLQLHQDGVRYDTVRADVFDDPQPVLQTRKFGEHGVLCVKSRFIES